MSPLLNSLGNTFEHFVNQIPVNILNKDRIFLSENIIIFKTSSFLPNITINTVDYHFAIPTVTPPIIKIGTKEYQLKKGRMVIINPDMEFTVLDNIHTDEYIVVCIKREFLNKVSYEITSKNNIHFFNVENLFSAQLYMAINNFISECSLHNGKSNLMLESLSNQIAILLLREAKSNISKSIILPIIDGDFVELAKEYFRNYYNTDITLDEICNLVHVSPSHFMRTFKAKTGLSAHKYLLTVRLENAKEMLGKTKITIEQICSQCGFINPSHFSNTFKKNFGISPIEYRRNTGI